MQASAQEIWWKRKSVTGDRNKEHKRLEVEVVGFVCLWWLVRVAWSRVGEESKADSREEAGAELEIALASSSMKEAQLVVLRRCGRRRCSSVVEGEHFVQAEIQSLESEDCRLDAMICNMQENLLSLSEDESNQKWLYLTKEDISSIPCFQNSTLIAVKAPHGTSLEVPNPDEGLEFPQRQYQMLLRSSMGPIDCYLLSNHEERFEPSNLDQHFAAMDLSVQSSYPNISCMMAPRHRPGDQEQAEANKNSSDANISRDSIGGIVKITPCDDVSDYWLLSEDGYGVSESWRAA